MPSRGPRQDLSWVTNSSRELVFCEPHHYRLLATSDMPEGRAAGSPGAPSSDAPGTQDKCEQEPADLPEDVYGAMFFSIVHDGIEVSTDKDRDGLDRALNLSRVAFITMSLVFNYVLQGSFLWFSYWSVVVPEVRHAQRIYQEYHAECFDVDGVYNVDKCDAWPREARDELCALVITSFWPVYLILVVWWMTMLSEFRKTDRMWRKIMALKKAKVFKDQIEQIDGLWLVQKLMPEVKYALFCSLVVPKHLISGGLLVIGTWWLVSAPTLADLILNSLALTFIIEIDEMIFEALFPFTVVKEVNKMKVQQPPSDTNKEVWDSYVRSVMFVVSLLLGVYVYLVYFQSLPFFGVLPGFTDDVECSEYRMRKMTKVCDNWAIWNGAHCFPYGTSELQDVDTTLSELPASGSAASSLGRRLARLWP